MSRPSSPPGPVTAPTMPAAGTLHGAGPESPPARRSRPATWRDPRLVVGVALVAGSVLLGARLLGGADDSVPVWVAASDLRSGTTLRSEHLERRDVRFAESAAADRYLSAQSPPPAATVSRDVGAGELVPRAALDSGAAPSLVEVPVAVAAEAVPATVRPGSTVDVWVTPMPGDSDGDRAEAVLVLDDVVVVAAPRTGSALGPSATRQVIVGVGSGQRDRLAEALALAAAGTTVITKQG